MPDFTGAERAKIRQVLGFSELFHDLDPRLESQLDQLQARAPDAVANIRSNLAAIADIDSRLVDALDNLNLSDAEDGIKFYGPVQLEGLRDQGRMLIQQIAIIVELKPKRDYYGPGEDFSGGVIPLG